MYRRKEEFIISVIVLTVIQALDNSQGMIKNFIGIGMKSIQGAFLTLDSSDNVDIEEKTLVIKDSVFQNLGAFFFGAFAILNNFRVDMIIDNVKASECVSRFGSFINLQDIRTLRINNSQLKQMRSDIMQFSVIYAQSDKAILVSITNTILKCENNYDNNKIIEILRNQEKLGSSVLYFSNTFELEFENNTFSHCHHGSLIQLSSVFSFKDKHSTYFNNSAYDTAVMNLQNSKAVISNIKIYNNMAYECAGISLDVESSMDIAKSEFRNNYAINKVGAIRVVTKSTLNIIDSVFHENVAENEISTINIFGSTDIMYGYEINFINCEFTDNYNQAGSRGIFIGFSAVSIISTQFEDTDSSRVLKKIESNKNTQGSFLYVLVGVDLKIQSSMFKNGYSYLGGSDVSIEDSTFQNNKAFQGAAIVAQQFDSLNIFKKCQFIENYAIKSGDDIYALKIDGMIVLNSNPSNSLELDTINFYADNLKITRKNDFQQNFQIIDSKGKVQQVETGGAISCQSCGQFHLNNSMIKNTNAQSGGAIYLSQNDMEKFNGQNYIVSKLTILNYSQIKNTEFESTWSTMYDGGAIGILNIKKLTIIDSSFNNCSSKMSGGAFRYDCPSQTYDCEVILIGLNRFTNNKASTSGGAFYWNENEPKFDMKKIYFYNNIAGIYGNNIGCYAQKLGKITEQRFLQIKETTMRSLASEVVTGAQSSSNATGFRSGDSISTNYQPIIEGQSIFYSENGVFTVTGLQFTGEPGYSYSIVFDTDGIDNSKPANKQQLYQSNNEEKSNFNLNVELRECQIGEKFSDQGSCELCPEGSSFSLVKMTSPGSCQVCPTSVALCYGGSFIGPKPGYWRMNNRTSKFIECLNPEACLGIIPPYFKTTGSCDIGYEGILCSSCSQDYSRTGSFKCSKCPESSTNILRLIGIGNCAVIIVVLLIKSTLNGALVKRNVMSIFQKIFMNHLQLIMMTASFNYNWPAKVVEFFSSSQPVAQAQTQVLSVDCFINKGLGQSQISNEEITYQSFGSGITSSLLYLKLLMFAVLPFLLAILSYCFWMIVSCKKQSENILKTKAVSSLVILLFLIHPTLVSFFFKAFDCIEVDGESRNKEDLQINCNTKQHQYFSLLIALPGLIVWGIGIPFFAFALMFRKSKNLDNLETRAQYGFLFRGYKKQFYYWEIVIMYRKIILIFISVFVVSNGIITQFSDDYFKKTAILNCNIKQLRDNIINNIYNNSVLWTILYLRYYDNYCLGGQYIIYIKYIRNNIIFFAYWSYELIKELNSLLILKFGKLYLMLFLCDNNQRFDKLKKQMAINEENEILRENFMSYLADIKKLYSSGQIILNKNVIERLQLYLSREKILEILGKKNIVIALQDESDDKQIQAYREIRKSNTKELRQSIPTMDISRSIEDLNEEDFLKDNDQGKNGQRLENLPVIMEYEDEQNYFDFKDENVHQKQQIIKDSIDQLQPYKVDEVFNQKRNFKDDQDIVKRLRGFSCAKEAKNMRIQTPGYNPQNFENQYLCQNNRKYTEDAQDYIQQINLIKIGKDQTLIEEGDKSDTNIISMIDENSFQEELDMSKNNLVIDELFQVVQKKKFLKKISRLRKIINPKSKILQQSASLRIQTKMSIPVVQNVSIVRRGTVKISQERQSNDLEIELKNKGMGMLSPTNQSNKNQSNNQTPILNQSDGFTTLNMLKDDGEDEQLFIEELDRDLDIIERFQRSNDNLQ
ncbi:UNKNOWN [Stylonychia lemnae]|uniref:Transmembrane protein n=1 Tax=Stylonychia lemnae TaxID=5949 RepID=A0A078B6Y5_STYLE|nr:UNKNOWN [Stylonychia lemnae]|eukprot:CDW90149.1 UNKNOWN [Stylonychia lemnae]